MKKNTTEIRVRYAETDQMGIAHHASYFTWFEAARTELMRECGLSYRQLEERGFLLPVIDAYCRYRKSLTYDDIARIETRMLEIGGASLKIGYTIVRASDGIRIAEGYTRHAFTDRRGNVLRIPGFFRKIFE